MIDNKNLTTKQLDFRIGDNITGEVLSITNDGIIVSLIGYESKGLIPLNEITVKNTPQEILNKIDIGDKITSKIIKLQTNNNLVVLSKLEYEKEVSLETLKFYIENKVKFNIKITEVKENGLVGYYNGIRIFVPASQIDVKFIVDKNKFLNEVIEIILIEMKLERPFRIIGSRRSLKEVELQEAEEKAWSILKTGEIVQGEVKRFTDFGAFINVNGIDGLVHLSQISWLHVKHPKDYLSIGDFIDVKILDVNKLQKKLSLSIKELTPEPWSMVQTKYIEDSIILGKVVRLNDFGAFIELEPGIDGLVHISKISHNKISNPNDVLIIGEEIKARILSVDVKNKRISLSIKDV